MPLHCCCNYGQICSCCPLRSVEYSKLINIIAFASRVVVLVQWDPLKKPFRILTLHYKLPAVLLNPFPALVAVRRPAQRRLDGRPLLTLPRPWDLPTPGLMLGGAGVMWRSTLFNVKKALILAFFPGAGKGLRTPKNYY